MKIACPQCGQHYEVEAGALDRYFRCTECQMLFRGLNAKPVKVRKFRRKNKAVDETSGNEAAALEVVTDINPAATTAAVAVENMEKEAVEAEARFWEKSLEDDAIAEKAVRYSKPSVSLHLIVTMICVVLLAVTFAMAMIANSKVNDLLSDHKVIDGKEAAYKERVEKIEQHLESVQASLQILAASEEKMKLLLEHINTKVNDQTIARKVDELEKTWEKHYKNAEELKQSIDECRDKLERFAEADKAAAKQRKSRR